MILKNFFLFFILLLVPILVSAQDNPKRKVIVYKPFVSGEVAEKESDEFSPQNMIKWNSSLIGRGALLINYERLFKPKLSFEVGLGPTYRDFEFEFNGFYNKDWTNDGGTKIKLGFMAEGGLRFYPVEGDMEGIYIQGSLRYRKYNIFTDLNSGRGAAAVSNAAIGYQVGEACIMGGRQWDNLAYGVILDVYGGVSWSNVNYHTIEHDSFNIDYSEKAYKSVPRILLGCKFCLPL